MKKIAEIDKRNTPRFRTDSVRISGDFTGQVINMNNGGASIQSKDILKLQEKFLLNIEFPSKVFSTAAVLKWKYAENGHFVYGAEFARLDSKDAIGLWRFLYRAMPRKGAKAPRTPVSVTWMPM